MLIRILVDEPDDAELLKDTICEANLIDDGETYECYAITDKHKMQWQISIDAAEIVNS